MYIGDSTQQISHKWTIDQYSLIHFSSISKLDDEKPWASAKVV